MPLSVEQVTALAEAMPERYRTMVLAQASLGLRIGELLALRVEDVDSLRPHPCGSSGSSPKGRTGSEASRRFPGRSGPSRCPGWSPTHWQLTWRRIRRPKTEQSSPPGRAPRSGTSTTATT